MTVQQGLASLCGELGPRSGRIEIHILGQCLHEALEVVRDVATGPGGEGPLIQAQVRIRDDQVRVDLHTCAQPAAIRAGSEG